MTLRRILRRASLLGVGMLLLSGCVSVQEHAIPGGASSEEYRTWPVKSVSWRHGYNTGGWVIVYLNREAPQGEDKE